MADTDFARLSKHVAAFDAAAAKYGLPSEVLMGIASRESRAGAALDADGCGDGGNAYGIMQVRID